MAHSAHASCCHAHAKPSLSLVERLTHAQTACVARGGRLTPQRRDVLKVLLEAGKVMGAYDLIEALAARTAKRVAPITIYRALDFLVEMGLVHRIESRNAFLACPGRHEGHAHAVFMICDCCGRVDEGESPQVEAALAALAGERGFRTKARVVEIAGLCAACGSDRGQTE